MSTFDPTKPVQQRNGRAAHISEVLAEDQALKHGWRIIGYYINASGDRNVGMWMIDGTYDPSHQIGRDNDLLNVAPRIKGWVNVYRHPDDDCFSLGMVFYESEEQARNCRKPHFDDFDGGERCIACIPIEFTEGEGLS